MKIQVICCNDSIQHAVVDDEHKARARLEQLRKADFERSRWLYKDFQEYKANQYWHIHTVNGE